jgi:hypothetical protein
MLAGAGGYSNAGYNHSENCDIYSINGILTKIAYYILSQRLWKTKLEETFMRTRGASIF